MMGPSLQISEVKESESSKYSLFLKLKVLSVALGFHPKVSYQDAG